MPARRRRFLQSLSAAPLLPAVLAQAQATPAETSPKSALARHLAEVVRARYGGQLEAADLDEVERLIGESLDAAEKLRSVKLTNADEPVALFSARRPEPAAPRPAGARPAPKAAPSAAKRPAGGRP